MGNKSTQKTVVHVPGIREGEDGKFTIDVIRVLSGKRVHIYSSGYDSLEEAVKTMPQLIEEKLSSFKLSHLSDTTFGEFSKKYDEYRLLHVRTSSVQFGRSVIRNYCKGWDDLTVRKCFSFDSATSVYNTLLTHKGTPAWKNRCFGVFRQMAEAAFKWKIIDSSTYQDCIAIFENIPENRGAKKEKVIWNKRERQRFFDGIEDETDNLMFSLLSALGLRIGEFTGLTWDCYDSKSGTIEVKQQLVYADAGKWVLSSQLKTRESYRTCHLSPKMNERLREFKEKGTGKGFIFHKGEDEKEPMSKATLRRKLYLYQEKAGIKRVTPHAFRHAKATDLMRVCKNMQEVKAAARFLGHSATMMIDTYGHCEQTATEAVLRRLEKEDQ